MTMRGALVLLCFLAGVGVLAGPRAPQAGNRCWSHFGRRGASPVATNIHAV